MLNPILLDKTRSIQVFKFALLILKTGHMIRSPPILVILLLPLNLFFPIFCSVLGPRRLICKRTLASLPSGFLLDLMNENHQ